MAEVKKSAGATAAAVFSGTAANGKEVERDFEMRRLRRCFERIDDFGTVFDALAQRSDQPISTVAAAMLEAAREAQELAEHLITASASDNDRSGAGAPQGPSDLGAVVRLLSQALDEARDSLQALSVLALSAINRSPGFGHQVAERSLGDAHAALKQVGDAAALSGLSCDIALGLLGHERALSAEEWALSPRMRMLCTELQRTGPAASTTEGGAQ